MKDKKKKNSRPSSHSFGFRRLSSASRRGRSMEGVVKGALQLLSKRYG